MADVCVHWGFYCTAAPNEQEDDDLKSNPSYFISTSQTLSIVQDLLSTLSSSFSSLIVDFVMTNPLQAGFVWLGSVRTADGPVFWQVNSQVQGAVVAELDFIGPKECVEAA